MWIAAPAAQIYDSFIEPERLTKFWLASASAPLKLGATVRWEFLVPGASAETTATRLERGKCIEWQWPDGSTVRIDLEAVDDGTAVTIVNGHFPTGREAQVEAALNSTEGFAIVLCDLKTLLELGQSAGLARAKARLIEARRPRS